MDAKIRIGILGAGLGSRMQSRSKAKPLARLGGRTLLERLIDEFQTAGVGEITCALRAELIDSGTRRELPRRDGLHWHFVDTESSLHTLYELIRRMGTNEGALFSMVDTILRSDDLRNFLHFCRSLEDGCCAVLVTPFVDDEKPLWVQVNRDGFVTCFHPTQGEYVTSGMYFLTPKAMNLAGIMIAEGTHKMRNFLSKLVDSGIPIKTFVVTKTIDVDHPSDLNEAEEFLRCK